MTTMYQGSKGPVAIESMAQPHLKSALAKLLRERVGEERQDEVDAMSKRLDALDAEYAAKMEGVGANAEPTPASEAVEVDEPPPVGHNNPPEETAWEAIKAHLDDLLMEARNWADGVLVETQEQADEIARLKSDLADGANAAEAQRVKEKKPLDDAIAAIQDKFNAYIAPKQNKKPGKVTLAIQALNAALTPYLQKQEDEKRAKAEAARKEAEAKAAAAAEALRRAQANDLPARESAEDLIAEAEAAQAIAKAAEKDKAHAHGGARATGLRSFWRAEMTDRKAALIHYLNTQPEAFEGFLQRLADQDVAAGKRQVPGFNIIEERKVA